MNITTKIISTLTAISITVSACAGLCASADAYGYGTVYRESIFDNIYLGENNVSAVSGTAILDGYPYNFTGTYGDCEILITTDGTVPTAEDFADLPEFVSVTPWETFYEEAKQRVYCPSDESAFSSVTESENLYVVEVLDDGKGDLPLLIEDDYISRLGRELVLQHDWITDAQQFVVGGLSKWMCALSSVQDRYEFSISLDEGASLDDIPELAGYDYELNEFTNYYGVTSYHYSFDIVENTGTTIRYDNWNILFALANTLTEKYEFVNVMELCCVLESASDGMVISGASVWQSAGDPNADGEVNSADAAELLVQAAQNGSVTSAKATASAETPDPAADVNADGVVDALDASYVLQFAAANGSGAPVSWVELLRN